MTKPVRKYTKEFKEEAVHLALKSPSISRTASELGIPMPTLHSWVTQLKKPTDNTEQAQEVSSEMKRLLEENRRLQKELAIAREEKEILKKAATYFAQNQK